MLCTDHVNMQFWFGYRMLFVGGCFLCSIQHVDGKSPKKKYICTHTHTYTCIRGNLLTPSMIYYFLYFPCNRRKDSCGRYRQIRQWNERCWCSSGGRKIIENMNQNAPHPPTPSFFPLLNFIFWLRSCPIGHRECIPFCLDTEDDTGLSIHDTLRVIKLKERKGKWNILCG